MSIKGFNFALKIVTGNSQLSPSAGATTLAEQKPMDPSGGKEVRKKLVQK
jgi:hypothetical protein